ncbi:MAG: hypothetical protein U1C51_05070 [Candidatus Izemoplasmatales bacterium]|nr:hypothetical protein [bacterium]MDZ4196606.1 hypothetical protein [Candidatus Izemoplasmatales bacterium]
MMKKLSRLIWIDLKRLFQVRIVHLIFVLSFLLGMAMAFFPQIDPSNLFYLAVFILPVIVFSISMFIEKEEILDNPPICCNKKDASIMVFSKILSSLLLMLLPILFFELVLVSALNRQISYGLLLLAYLVGATLHILVGLFIAMASKTGKILAISYIVYILVFSLTPVLYGNGIIPLSFQYVMLISPAYISGVLIDNILFGQWYSPVWLLIFSSVIQFVYIFVLIRFAIIPHFCKYMIAVHIEDEE